MNARSAQAMTPWRRLKKSLRAIIALTLFGWALDIDAEAIGEALVQAAEKVNRRQ